MDSDAFLCHRCGCSLHPGEGDLYVVRIEGVADPYPPKLDGSLLEGDFDREYNRLLERMREMVRDMLGQEGAPAPSASGGQN